MTQASGMLVYESIPLGKRITASIMCFSIAHILNLFCSPFPHCMLGVMKHTPVPSSVVVSRKRFAATSSASSLLLPFAAAYSSCISIFIARGGLETMASYCLFVHEVLEPFVKSTESSLLASPSLILPRTHIS